MSAAITPMDDSRDHRIPGATSRRRVKRRTRSGTASQWTTGLPWSRLTPEEVEAKPTGSRMSVSIAPGVFATVVKIGPGVWALCRRSGIPSEALAAVPTAPRVQVAQQGGQ